LEALQLPVAEMQLVLPGKYLKRKFEERGADERMAGEQDAGSIRTDSMFGCILFI
jgi:hypothetical protein